MEVLAWLPPLDPLRENLTCCSVCCSHFTQACLDEHLLPAAVGGATRHALDSDKNQDFRYTLQLPEGVTCNACVLQWKYNAGTCGFSN